ncbi:MAG: hypothetical protein AAFZ80_04555 [Cyanobacteria bacterium P01_A01_bin.105]
MQPSERPAPASSPDPAKPPPKDCPDVLREQALDVATTRADEGDDLQRLQTLINLVPVLGIVPSLWTLYRGEQAHPTVRSVSRIAVVLAFSWVSATVLLGAGANLPLSHLATVRLLLANGFVGTSYFVISFWLMWRVWQRQSTRLPIITPASRRLP